jgi:Ion channel
MLNTIQQCLNMGRAFAVYLLESISLYIYLAVFIGVVVGSGWLYYVLTPYGHGVGKDSMPFTEMTFPLGIYFSVVTISSLGYGDMHPLGFSRILACVEVLFGLAFMGIVIAKLTSRRLAYHVERLFAADAQRRLEDFAMQFEKSEQELREVMKILGQEYQGTPGAPGRSSDEKSMARNRLASSLSLLHARGAAWADYLSYECRQGEYFGLIPPNAMLRVGDSVDTGSMLLGQLIISLPIESRTDVLDVQNRQRISDFLRAQKTVCGMVQQHASDEAIRNCFRRVLDTCNSVPEQYFAVPIVGAAQQPDQKLHGSDEPTEPRLSPTESSK